MPKSNANLALKGLDEMFSTEESRQEQKREQVQQIPIEELFPFKEHPFKVLDDEAMQRTVESVAQYAALPRMVMMTYKIPESIQQIAKQGEYDEFDLNVFFSAKGKGRDCRFAYEDYVQKWLDLMRCSYLETTVDELKLGAKKPALPFADSRLLNVLQHTLWFLPNVASCWQIGKTPSTTTTGSMSAPVRRLALVLPHWSRYSVPWATRWRPRPLPFPVAS